MMDRFALSPSVKRALHAVSKFAQSSKYGDGSAVPAGESKLRQCWSRFAPVAPLWAAFCLNSEYSFAAIETAHREEVARFLGIAAGLRAFAVSFVPKRARPPVPILDPDSTWEMPGDIEPLRLTPSDFPNNLAAFLSNYKAPARKVSGD